MKLWVLGRGTFLEKGSPPKTFDFIESPMTIISGLKIVAHQRKRRASAYGCSSFKNLFKELKENDGWA